MNIFWLLFAHCLGDATFQTDRMASSKGTVLRHMVSHCVVYTGTVCLALTVLGQFEVWKLLVLFSSHLMIDTFLHDPNDVKKVGRIGWIDQGLHLFFLGVCLL